jgi:RDD family
MRPLDPIPAETWVEEDEEPTHRVGFRRRVPAALLDLAAIALLSIFWGPWIGFRLGLATAGGLGPGAGGIIVAATAGTLLIALLWFGTEAIWGWTPGKRLLGIQIGTDEGFAAQRSRMALRWSIKSAPLLLALFALLLSLLAPGVGRWLDLLAHLCALVVVGGCLLIYGSHRQALHDMLAHTAVYRRAELLPPDEA